MYSKFSLAAPTPMTVTSSVVSSESQRFTFIDQTGQPLSVESSQTQRRIVRSHAMVDVRRRQMLQLDRNFQLRWTDPKVKVNVNEGVCESCSPIAHDYEFIDQSFEAKEGAWERDEEARRKAPHRSATSRRSDQYVHGSKKQSSPSSQHRIGRNFLPGIDQITGLGSDEDPKQATTRGQQPSSTSTLTTPLDIWATSSPTSFLGAGRVNPFENFPVEVDQDLHELIDHYTVVIPLLIYGTRCRNPVQKSFYYLAINDPAAFHTMLAFAARHLDSLHDAKQSKRALYHTIKAVRAVNEQLKRDTYPLNNETVYSVALLAVTERRFGCRAVSQNHWVGLKEILMHRGGLGSLSNDRTLKAMITWNYMVWSGCKETASSPSPVNWPSLTSTSPDDRLDLERACDEFIEFFSDLESTSSYLHFLSSTSSAHSSLLARRREVFAPGSSLHKILSSQIQITQTCTNTSRSNHFQRQWTAKRCQMPCLIYLNIAFLDYADDPATCEHFLSKLEACVLEEDEGRSISPEHLLIRLLIGLEEEVVIKRRPGRVQEVVRLTDVFKRLSDESSGMAYNVLWKALAVESLETDSDNGTQRFWNVNWNYLRLQILGSDFT